MKIPKELKIFSHTLKIKYSKTLRDRKGAVGLCDYENMTLWVQASTRKNPLTGDFIEQTFYHELVHMILYLSGDVKISHSSVDVLGSILKQVFEQLPQHSGKSRPAKKSSE